MQKIYLSARQAYQKKEFSSAKALCDRLVAGYPEFSHGWDLASRVAFSLKQYKPALAYIDKALLIEIKNPIFLAQKAYCLLALNNKNDSYKFTLDATENIDNGNAGLLDILGNLYSLHNKPEKALDMFEQAAALRPDSAGYQSNLALIKQAMGDIDGAEEAFNRTLSCNPKYYDVYLHRSRLRTQTKDNNHIKDLIAILADSHTHPEGEICLRYALCKEYEDIGEYSDAFKHLEIGAKLRRSRLRYNVQTELKTIEQIIHCYSQEVMQKNIQGCDNNEPIFIVGLPRTGTTLVERILGACKDVYPAGELVNFSALLTSEIIRLGKNKQIDREQLVSLSKEVDFAALGRAYIESTRPDTGSSRYFIDKLPLNFLYCGLIHLALPKAKIIHLVRHPMDACYAIYKTLFKETYPFSYDLEDLGNYYIAYQKLMNHWHSVMPNQIFDLPYEELVSDQESVCKRLFDYCDLKWNRAYLDVHKNTSYTATASLSQVRQPIYTSSVDRWRSYETQLEPLKRILSDAGIYIN